MANTGACIYMYLPSRTNTLRTFSVGGCKSHDLPASPTHPVARQLRFMADKSVSTSGEPAMGGK